MDNDKLMMYSDRIWVLLYPMPISPCNKATKDSHGFRLCSHSAFEKCRRVGKVDGRKHATTSDSRRGGGATSALKIISDIREFRMTAIDVECLHWLVDDLVRQGQTVLLSQLQAGAPDCEICEALATRMDLQLPPE